jgi:methionyl-tRNA formyltransferase
LKIIFFGSPSYSCIILKKVLEKNYNVVGIVTQDKKKGKRNKNTNTAVGEFGEKNLIKTFYPSNINDSSFLTEIEKLSPDIFLVYSFGKMLPERILNIPKIGAINIHCSLLPKWRGAAPIQKSLLNDDDITGVTFFKINSSLDQGNIISSFKYSISDEDDSLILQDKLSNLAADNITNVLESFPTEEKFIIQNNNDASYASKIEKSEAAIDWKKSCRQIFCKVRAFVGWPVAETSFFDTTFKIWKVSYKKIKSNEPSGAIINFNPDFLGVKAADGVIKIEKLQFPGKKVITARDLYNSNTLFSKKVKSFFNK